MTRRLFPCPRSSDAATTPYSYSSSSTSPALTTTSKKHPVISAPFSKRSQPIGVQQGMMGANNIGCHYRLEPRVIDRRSSWESTRRGQVGCYEREGVRESLVSVVVTEPDDRRFHSHAEEDRESLASIREKHSSRNDTSTYSMYTSQCIEELNQQEDGAVPAWFNQFSATPPNASQTSLSPSFDIREIPSIPSTPTLSPSTSLHVSPVSTSPATPPSPAVAQYNPNSLSAAIPLPQSPPLQPSPTFDSHYRSSLSPTNHACRVRSQTSSPSLSSSPSPTSPPSASHSSNCGLPFSIFPSSSRSSPLPISSPRPLLNSEDFELLPPSSCIPLHQEGWAQKYAPMVEEGGWGRWYKRRPEVRVRERYKSRREPPGIPEGRRRAEESGEDLFA